MLALVETCSAFFRFAEIAMAHSRVLSRSISARRFRHRCRHAARGEGLLMRSRPASLRRAPPASCRWDFVGTVAVFSDLDGFRQTVRRSRRLGFVGASVIIPARFRSSTRSSARAPTRSTSRGRVVAAYDKALAEGVGAVTVDGKMIDVPVVERAQALLDR